jgi:hypothetical protein
MMPRQIRNVIRIEATDSPNVQLALEQQRLGLPVTGETVVPGVLSWAEYQDRLATWSEPRKEVGLYARFYEGAEELLFPPAWMDAAALLSYQLSGAKRVARGGGCDPAQGGDKTTMCAVDEFGIIELTSKKTPNTVVCCSEAIAFIRKHNIPPERFCFDLGGGKEHADRIRHGDPSRGIPGLAVRAIGFGEAPQLEIKRGLHQIEQRKDAKEEAYAYVNRRAQMYHEASLLFDPSLPETGLGPTCWTDAFPGKRFLGFACPKHGPVFVELRRQLEVMPKLTDLEGRYWMLPKNKRNKEDKRKTLVELIGHSPDEADAFVLACHSMLHKSKRATAGSAIR